MCIDFVFILINFASFKIRYWLEVKPAVRDWNPNGMDIFLRSQVLLLKETGTHLECFLYDETNAAVGEWNAIGIMVST